MLELFYVLMVDSGNFCVYLFVVVVVCEGYVCGGEGMLLFVEVVEVLNVVVVCCCVLVLVYDFSWFYDW